MKYQVMLTDGRTFSDSCVRAVEWLPGCMEIVPDGGVPEIVPISLLKSMKLKEHVRDPRIISLD